MAQATLDNFEKLLDESFSKTNSVADIVEGTILKREKDGYLVSVHGTKTEAFLPDREIASSSEETPELEDIRDSDGISHNATKVLSLNQKDAGIVMSIKKNRDGVMGDKLTYLWDIDKGTFEWLPASDDTATEETKTKRKEQIKEEYKEKGDIVF